MSLGVRMPLMTTGRAHHLLFLLAVLAQTSAWRTQGALMPMRGRGFAYAGKFCYAPMNNKGGVWSKDIYEDETEDTDQKGYRRLNNSKWHGPGLLEITVEGNVIGGKDWSKIRPDYIPSVPGFPPAPGGFYLAVFNDVLNVWSKVRERWNTLTEMELLDSAVAVRAVTPIPGKNKFVANITITETDRPRFFFFVFVFLLPSEEYTGDQIVTYHLHATNGGFKWESEFSVDDQGGIPLYIISFFMFFFVSGVTIAATVWSFGTGAFRMRPLLQLAVISSLLSTASCFALLVDQVAYAGNGKGLGMWQVAGELMAALARLVMACLMIFVAHGKALFSGSEQAGRRTCLIVVLSCVIIMSLGCEIYMRYFGKLDWSTTLYFYQSWPGLTLLALNTILFLEVCRSTYQLIRRAETSRAIQRFYLYTFMAAMLYFLTVPVLCIMAPNIHTWNRKRIVRRTEVFVRFAATVILLLVMRPSRIDSMISARMETPDKRAVAIELSDRL